jgi:hypothetical protein
MRWRLPVAAVVVATAWTALASSASTTAPPHGVARSGRAWLNLIHAPEAWRISAGDPRIRIAVVDLGLDHTHPELKGRIVDSVDLGAGDSDPMSLSVPHGTAVAGIIAATCPRCSLLGIKIADDRGRVSSSDLPAGGIRWAVDHEARVINLSGSWYPSKNLSAAVLYAWRHRAVVVASAGNGDDWSPVYPAGYSETVAVGAADSRGARLAYSAFGPFLDVLSPAPVVSTGPRGSYVAFGGTSAAAPVVSAALGLLFSLHPELSAPQAVAALKASAVDVGPAGRDDDSGAGRVDLLRLLRGKGEGAPLESRCSLPVAREPVGSVARTLAFVSSCEGSFDVYTALADGTGARRITRSIAADTGASLSPDGRWVAFLRGPPRQCDVFVMRSTGGQARRVTSFDTGGVRTPSWSPDGRLIAFAGLDTTGRGHLYTIRPDGTGLRQVSPARLEVEQAAWSPDGRYFAVSSGRYGSLWLLAADGAVVRRLTTAPEYAGDVDPAWSPSSNTIAFARRTDEGGSIYLVRTDGTHQRRVTPTTSDSRSPTWVASTILFSARYGGNADLFSIEQDGTGLRRFFATPASEVGVAALPR